MKFFVEVKKFGNSHYILLPAFIVHGYNIKPKTKLTMKFRDGKITIYLGGEKNVWKLSKHNSNSWIF